MAKGKKQHRGTARGPSKSNKKEKPTSTTPDDEFWSAIGSTNGNLTSGAPKGSSGGSAALFRLPYLLAIVCALTSLALYYNTHSNGWAYDDSAAIVWNADVQGTTPLNATLHNDFWGDKLATPGSNKSFRPLTVLSFRLNAAWSGLDPGAFHVVNNVLNAIAASMAVWTIAATRYGSRPHYLGVASLIFAFHPIHVEAVASTVGRAELLGAILAFGAFCCHSKSMTAAQSVLTSSAYLLAAMVLGFTSALAKEPSLMVLAICGAHEIASIWLPLTSTKGATVTKANAAYSKKELMTSVLRFVLLALTGAAYMEMRIRINGESFGIVPQFKDNPLFYADSTQSLVLTALHIQATYAWKLIYPFNFSCDYGFNVIPMIDSLGDVQNLLTLVWMAGMVLLVWIGFQDARGAKRDPRLLVALAWIVGPLLPASHVLTLGTVLAERLLYIPSLGYGMLLGLVIERMGSSGGTKRASSSSALPIIAIGLAIFSQSIVARNRDWLNGDTLFEADHKSHPQNVKLGTMYATRLIMEADYTKAIEISSNNYNVLPDDVGNIINLAKSTAMNGNFEKGHVLIDRAINIVEGREWPKDSDHKAYSCKAYIQSKQNRNEEAKVNYEKAFKLAQRRNPEDISAYCNLGEVNAVLGNWAESVPFLEKCERHYSRTPDDRGYTVYLENLAKAYYSSKQWEKGVKFCEKALNMREDESIRRIYDHMIRTRKKKEEPGDMIKTRNKKEGPGENKEEEWDNFMKDFDKKSA